MSKIGTHIPIRATLFDTYVQAQNLSCDAFQIFLGGNIGYNRKKIAKEDSDNVISNKLDENTFFSIHSVYTFSLANPEVYKKGKNAVVTELELASRLKNSGVVVHPGSAKGRPLDEALTDVCRSILDLYGTAQVPLGTLLLENSAGQGCTLPNDLESFVKIFNCIDQFSYLGTPMREKVGVCLDTAHLQGVGQYDLSKIPDIDRLYSDIEKTIGIDRIKLIHLNDSGACLGSMVDCHATLGKGYIWKDNPQALRYFVKKFSAIPMVTETGTWDEDRAILTQIL